MTTPLCPRCGVPLFVSFTVDKAWCTATCAYGHDAPRSLIPQPDAPGWVASRDFTVSEREIVNAIHEMRCAAYDDGFHNGCASTLALESQPASTSAPATATSKLSAEARETILRALTWYVPDTGDAPDEFTREGKRAVAQAIAEIEALPK